MRFKVLDGWRGIAAILVALFHSAFYGHSYTIPFIRNAYLFVDFFFVLSGFVITHAYAQRLTTARSYASFLVRRFGRLWPLHAAMLGLFFISEVLKLVAARHGDVATDAPAFSAAFSVDSLVANLFLVHSLGLYNHLTWNFPSWSISAEFYAYFVFIAVAALFREKLAIAAAIIAALSAFVILRYSNHAPIMDTTYDFGFFRCLLGFFVGHLVYQIYKRQFETQHKIPHPEITEPLALVIMFVSEGSAGILSIAAPLIFGLVVYVFAFESGPVSRALLWKPFAHAGAWSYSIYMVHAFIGISILRVAHLADRIFGHSLFEKIELNDQAVFTTALPRTLYWMDLLNLGYLAAVIAASCVTFYLIEEPSRKFFNGLLRRLLARPRVMP